MSTELETSGGAVAEEQSFSLLEQAISSTKQTEREETQDLLANLTEQVLKGTVTWDRNLTNTIKLWVAASDEAMSRQLTAILHDEKFQKLEGSWRGLIPWALQVWRCAFPKTRAAARWPRGSLTSGPTSGFRRKDHLQRTYRGCGAGR